VVEELIAHRVEGIVIAPVSDLPGRAPATA
jgi:hypothetical protein